MRQSTTIKLGRPPPQWYQVFADFNVDRYTSARIISVVLNLFLEQHLYENQIITWVFRYHPIYQALTNIGPRACPGPISESGAIKSDDNGKPCHNLFVGYAK